MQTQDTARQMLMEAGLSDEVLAPLYQITESRIEEIRQDPDNQHDIVIRIEGAPVHDYLRISHHVKRHGGTGTGTTRNPGRRT